MPDGEARLAWPPWTTNSQGRPRRVGVELEMNGLGIDRTARLVAGSLGLEITRKGRYECVLTGDAAGEWVVELDFELLKRMGREEREPDTLGGGLGNSAEDILMWLAETVVPLELVTPPLPLERLHEVQDLIAVLREAGAKGTSDRMLNVFGMQFNPEVPQERAETITAVLKAFFCLYDWLFERADIGLSRRVAPFIDPFPTGYARKVIDPDYRPDMTGLIDDYLTDNPTRNRALDLLPLFLHLDEARVRARVSDPLVKARPAFHYRLPDCEIHLPGWGLHLAWNDWVEVERLAHDRERLEACCKAYRVVLDDPLGRWLHDWKDQVQARWLAR